jgi:hypothetical protein
MRPNKRVAPSGCDNNGGGSTQPVTESKRLGKRLMLDKTNCHNEPETYKRREKEQGEKEQSVKMERELKRTI